MILAAGRGERMRPLTDSMPKPLLQVKGKALIEHHLLGLRDSGYSDVVINHAWLGQQLVESLGSGQAYGVNIHYSAEDSALETAGGIINALPILTPLLTDNKVFTVVNGDIYCDFDFGHLPSNLQTDLAHLVMADNPPHNALGDFYLEHGRLSLVRGVPLTFSGIAVYHRDFFAGFTSQKQPLAPLLRQQIENQRVSGYHHQGVWFDIGTPQRLEQINGMEGV